MEEKHVPTILVVDDEIEILTLLQELLQRRGYSVTTAERGEVALTIAGHQSFDIILADLKMPGMDGFKFVERLRRVQPAAKLVVMSGYGQQVQPALEEIGVENYIIKPIDFDTLLKKFDELLDAGGIIHV